MDAPPVDARAQQIALVDELLWERGIHQSQMPGWWTAIAVWQHNHDGAVRGLVDAGIAGAGKSAKDEESAPTCGGESFSADTYVTMADGKRRAIDGLRDGDHVLAADPISGKLRARRVSHVWLDNDSDLATLKVRSGNSSAAIKTTSGHLVFDKSESAWVRVEDLKAGHKLLSATLGTLSVISVTSERGQAAMWDLTVERDHDFFVSSERKATAILVHNCPYNPGGDAAEYEIDEIAAAAYQHSGQGYAGGEARPSFAEIQAALLNGRLTSDRSSGNPRIIYRGVHVIVNESNIWRSTAFYKD